MEGFAVVLTTFNGEAYLDAQVESIRAQDAGPWRLYARDDGSTDGTVQKLAELAAGDARIETLPPDGRNLGPAASFGVLLQHALDRGERRVFLCDQDDVWLPGKCARLLRAMDSCEAQQGADMPALVHSDLRVVGPDLALLHPSLARLQRMEKPDAHRASALLLRNCVTGCASLVNAALLRIALPMPRVAMHDWWLAQCAAAFGDVRYVDEALVLYRQHGRNLVGARGIAARARKSLRSPAGWWSESARRFLAGLRQLWIIRRRSAARRVPMTPGVRDCVETLWAGLGEGRASLRTRIDCVRRSGALPRLLPLRALFLARIAALPMLRERLGDERAGLADEPPKRA